MTPNKIKDQLVLIQCDTHKELVLTFFRIQEFYESPNVRLKGIPFTLEDFLEENMDEDGNIDYFSKWGGFNFPSLTLKQWMMLVPYQIMTNREIKLIQAIRESKIRWTEPFYVIGALASDKCTVKHELAHGLYHLNPKYREEVAATLKAIPLKLRRSLEKTLRTDGYSPEVYDDEINAYLSTDTDEEIAEGFKIDVQKNEYLIHSLRDLFKKYKSE